MPQSQRTASPISFRLPAVEVALPHGLPLPGARTAQPKVLAVSEDEHSLRLDLEAQGGSTVEFTLRRNAEVHDLTADGATIVPPQGHTISTETKQSSSAKATSSRPERSGVERPLYLPSTGGKTEDSLEHLRVTFPPGDGYQQKTVTLHW